MSLSVGAYYDVTQAFVILMVVNTCHSPAGTAILFYSVEEKHCL